MWHLENVTLATKMEGTRPHAHKQQDYTPTITQDDNKTLGQVMAAAMLQVVVF